MTFNYIKLCFFSKFITWEKSKKNIHFFRHNFLNFYASYVPTVRWWYLSKLTPYFDLCLSLSLCMYLCVCLSQPLSSYLTYFYNFYLVIRKVVIILFADVRFFFYEHLCLCLKCFSWRFFFFKNDAVYTIQSCCFSFCAIKYSI